MSAADAVSLLCGLLVGALIAAALLFAAMFFGDLYRAWREDRREARAQAAALRDLGALIDRFRR